MPLGGNYYERFVVAFWVSCALPNVRRISTIGQTYVWFTALLTRNRTRLVLRQRDLQPHTCPRTRAVHHRDSSIVRLW